MRARLRDRLGHSRHARGRGPPGRGSRRLIRSLPFLPEPVRRRRGLERWAFVFLVLGAGTVFGTGVANICFALSLAFAVAWRVKARRHGEELLAPFRRTTPLHGPILVFVGLSILSCFFSTLPSRSLLELKGFGTFLLVPYLAGMLRDDEDAHLVLDVLRLTSVYLILRGLLDWFSGFDNVWDRLSGGMSVYMTYAGLLMALSLALAGRALSGGRSRGSRAFDLAVAAGGVLAVGLTFTRNAYLGLLVGALALALSWKPKAALLLPVLAGVFFLVMPDGVRERTRSFLDPRDETMLDRVVMWRAGRLMIQDRPLFGVGPGRVKELYPVYRQPGFVDPHPGHLHNNLVMIPAETGLPSLVAYLAFVWASLRGSFSIARGAARLPVRALARGALAAMAALFVAGFFEYNFGDVEILMATLVISALPFVPGDAENGPAGP